MTIGFRSGAGISPISFLVSQQNDADCGRQESRPHLVKTHTKACASVVALALVWASPSLASAQALTRPDPSRTPGAINTNVMQANIYETICVRGWTRTVRPPEDYTYRLKREQLRAWGYGDQRTRDYEEDHLIPLALGGSPTSPKNLWPEPLRGAWNAHVKDRLENYLHEQVCAGAIPLDKARSEIAKEWIAAYRRYLGEPQ